MQGSVSSLILASGRRTSRALRPARSAARIARSGVSRPCSRGRPALSASAEVGRSSNCESVTRQLSSGSSWLAALGVTFQPEAAASTRSAGPWSDPAGRGVSSGDCNGAPPAGGRAEGWPLPALADNSAAGRGIGRWPVAPTDGSGTARSSGSRRIAGAMAVESSAAGPLRLSTVMLWSTNYFPANQAVLAPRASGRTSFAVHNAAALDNDVACRAPTRLPEPVADGHRGRASAPASPPPGQGDRSLRN